jgi:hypothetical protein
MNDLRAVWLELYCSTPPTEHVYLHLEILDYLKESFNVQIRIKGLNHTMLLQIMIANGTRSDLQESTEFVYYPRRLMLLTRWRRHPRRPLSRPLVFSFLPPPGRLSLSTPRVLVQWGDGDGDGDGQSVWPEVSPTPSSADLRGYLNMGLGDARRETGGRGCDGWWLGARVWDQGVNVWGQGMTNARRSYREKADGYPL